MIITNIKLTGASEARLFAIAFHVRLNMELAFQISIEIFVIIRFKCKSTGASEASPFELNLNI